MRFVIKTGVFFLRRVLIVRICIEFVVEGNHKVVDENNVEKKHAALDMLSHFKSVLVDNRLGQRVELFVFSARIAVDRVCLLVRVPEGTHYSVFAKNAELFAFQLRERMAGAMKNFSLVEVRLDSHKQLDEWFGWRFQWVGMTPLSGKAYPLPVAQQKRFTSYIDSV